MRPYDAAQRIGIHVNTVRTWTMQEFREFFSPTAQGGDGHTRDITEVDLRVLTFINQLRREGRDKQDIVASLMAAQRRGFHLLPLPGESETIVPMAVVPREAAEQALVAERRMKDEHIRWLEGRVDELKDELAEVRDTSTGKIDALTRKLIEAETQLNMWRAGWRPPLEGQGK